MQSAMFPFNAQGAGLGVVNGVKSFGCNGTVSNVMGASGTYSGCGNPTQCGGWRRSKRRSKSRSRTRRSGLSKGTLVKISKKGSQKGHLAQVEVPDWNGMVKVRMLSGPHAHPHPMSIKSYTASRLKLAKRTNTKARGKGRSAKKQRAGTRKSGVVYRRTMRKQKGGDGTQYVKCTGYGVGGFKDAAASQYGALVRNVVPYS